jgi:hypothetical protein
MRCYSQNSARFELPADQLLAAHLCMITSPLHHLPQHTHSTRLPQHISPAHAATQRCTSSLTLNSADYFTPHHRSFPSHIAAHSVCTEDAHTAAARHAAADQLSTAAAQGSLSTARLGPSAGSLPPTCHCTTVSSNAGDKKKEAVSLSSPPGPSTGGIQSDIQSFQPSPIHPQKCCALCL